MKKKMLEMWRIHDVLFMNYKDAEKTEDGKEVVKKVYVGVDEDFEFDPLGESMESFGSWVYSDKEEAQEQIEEHNYETLVYERSGYYFKSFYQDIDIEIPGDGLLTVNLDKELTKEEFDRWCEDFIKEDQERKANPTDQELAAGFAKGPQKPKVEEKLVRAVFDAYAEFGHDAVLKSHIENPEIWTGKYEPMQNMDAVLLAKILYLGYEIIVPREE